SRGPLEYGAVMIGRDFHEFHKCQGTPLDSADRFLRREAQFRFRTARFPKDRRLLARPSMPIYDRQPAARLQSVVHRARQPWPVGTAVEGVRHEYEIDLCARERGDVVGVSVHELAIRYAAFRKPMAR